MPFQVGKWGVGIVSGKGISGMSGNDRICGVGYLRKADSLALCSRKYSYISSFDKFARAWFPSFCQNFERIYFLLLMIILGHIS